MSPFVRALMVVSACPLAAACVVETSSSSPRRGDNGGTVPYGSGTPASSQTGPSASPILVEVDTDKVMDAKAGEGVGVFTEYKAGGHWHVFWTCDTNVNPNGRLPCDFLVRVSVVDGVASNLKQESSDGSALTPVRDPLELRTTTAAVLHGMTFDTSPGARVMIDATVEGQHDPRFFFFVQGGNVNGGIDNARLTDPLVLVGKTP